MTKVLIIVTNHSELAGEPNGTYLPEVTHAIHELDKAKITYDFASILGGSAPLYGHDADELTTTMFANTAFSNALSDTKVLKQVDLQDYSAIFYPGGYGLLYDLIEDDQSHKAIKYMLAKGNPVSAVCHGPAVFGKVILDDGKYLVADRNVTGFTREEEVDYGTIDKIPFVLEELMMNSGATYQKRKEWEEFVVEDGNVITGQNPGSAGAIGRSLVSRIT